MAEAMRQNIAGMLKGIERYELFAGILINVFVIRQ